MRILFDGSALNYRLSGIGYYFYNLFANINKEYPENQYELLLINRRFQDPKMELFCQDKTVHYYEELRKKVFTKIPSSSPIPQYVFRKTDGLINRVIDRFRSLEKNTIFHGQEFLYDRFPRLINTLTIHDLTTELFPAFHTETNLRRSQKRIKFALKHCSLVCSVSQASKRDLLNLYPKFSGRVEVIHESCHPIFDVYKPRDNKSFLEKYHIDPKKPYLLSVCTIEPRKNLKTVLRVFRSLKKKKAYANFQLVLVGGKGWKTESFFRLLERHKNLDDIFLTGYVPLEELPHFYRYAACFLYLSFYEGFGLPILEAMKSACPIVASNTSSIPEVAGDAALLVNPDEEEEALMAIEQVLNDNVLQEDLVKKGLERGKLFNWQKAAKQQIKFYQKLIQLVK
ncbi:MAG: glycosyltransferase family 1 protein [Spirochaetota bacterium]